MTIKAFSNYQKQIKLFDNELTEDYKRTGEYRTIIENYNKIADIKHQDLNDKKMAAIEPRIRFIIRHHYFLTFQTICSIFPIILYCYISESLNKDGFDASSSFYSLIVKKKYNKFWTVKQYEAIINSLYYVFIQLLDKGTFDESLFCTLILFSDDLLFIKKIFDSKDDKLTEQLKSFLIREVLAINDINKYIDTDKAVLAIMYYSEAVPCSNELVKRGSMPKEAADFLSEYFDENEIRKKIIKKTEDKIPELYQIIKCLM